MSEQKKNEKPVCSFCGNDSYTKVVLQGYKEEKPVLVCTNCLPKLIHG